MIYRIIAGNNLNLKVNIAFVFLNLKKQQKKLIDFALEINIILKLKSRLIFISTSKLNYFFLSFCKLHNLKPMEKEKLFHCKTKLKHTYI